MWLVLLVAGLVWDAPKEWKPVEATSSMRIAQWELPGASEGEEGEVVIFYFGEGGGGGVEANLDRWFGQFEQPDGSSTRERATVTTRGVNGLEMTIADIRGTYVAPVRPGASERQHRPQHRMIAAVVEGGLGPWYVRVLGPESTVNRWEATVETFLSSFRPEG